VNAETCCLPRKSGWIEVILVLNLCQWYQWFNLLSLRCIHCVYNELGNVWWSYFTTNIRQFGIDQCRNMLALQLKLIHWSAIDAESKPMVSMIPFAITSLYTLCIQGVRKRLVKLFYHEILKYSYWWMRKHVGSPTKVVVLQFHWYWMEKIRQWCQSHHLDVTSLYTQCIQLVE
jgi:hypothetical protein